MKRGCEYIIINCIANICGLYATNDYAKGDLLFVLEGECMDEPDRYSIQIDEDTHILDEMGKFMNHSFEPNCSIKEYEVIALKDIKEGDELTFDYNTTERKMAFPFQDIETNREVKGHNNS